MDSSNAGVFVRDLARILAGAGADVTVMTPHSVQHDPTEGFRVRSFRWPGRETSLAHVDPRRWRNRARFGILLLSGIVTSLWALWRRPAQHVIAMWAVPSGLIALPARRLLRIPYTVWALGSDIWRIDEYPMGRRLLRHVLAGASNLHADGLQLARQVAQIAGRPCSFLATSRHLPSAEAVTPVELEPSRVHAIAVARFHPHKGLDVLLDAVSLLEPEVRTRFRLHVFGGGPEEEALRHQHRRLELDDCVAFGGFIDRDRLAAWLRAVNVAVVPSRIESIPLILGDVAQARCPLIATDVGDMGELVRRFRAGLVVAPGSPGALADAIRRVVVGDIPFEAHGMARLADHLSIDRSARLILDEVGSHSR